jgi:hypothetical protein
MPQKMKVCRNYNTIHLQNPKGKRGVAHLLANIMRGWDATFQSQDIKSGALFQGREQGISQDGWQDWRSPEDAEESTACPCPLLFSRCGCLYLHLRQS